MKYLPEEQRHTTRLAFVTLLFVVLLAIVSFAHLRTQSGEEQNAAVLRAYAR